MKKWRFAERLLSALGLKAIEQLLVARVHFADTWPEPRKLRGPFLDQRVAGLERFKIFGRVDRLLEHLLQLRALPRHKVRHGLALPCELIANDHVDGRTV